MAGRDVLARTWFDQARADLAAAEDSAATGHHEWACFQAQQAGEKALKAVLCARGRTSVLTHSLRRLVRPAPRTTTRSRTWTTTRAGSISITFRRATRTGSMPR